MSDVPYAYEVPYSYNDVVRAIEDAQCYMGKNDHKMNIDIRHSSELGVYFIEHEKEDAGHLLFANLDYDVDADSLAEIIVGDEMDRLSWEEIIADRVASDEFAATDCYGEPMEW